MAQSIQAIVRRNLGADSGIEAGQVVYTTRALLGIKSPGRPVPCVLKHRPETVIQIHSSALLPLSKFLQRWPANDFWILLHKGRLHAGDMDFLVQDPRTCQLGATPHRFESEGECLYYLHHYDLNPSAFLISRVDRIKKPAWFEMK